jgi:hypothetical protein
MLVRKIIPDPEKKQFTTIGLKYGFSPNRQALAKNSTIAKNISSGMAENS